MGGDRSSASINKNIQSLLHNHVLTRLGILYALIVDNKKRFDNKKFVDYCEKHHIHIHYTSVTQP